MGWAVVADAAGLLPRPGADTGIAAVVVDATLASRGLKKELQRLRAAGNGLDMFFLAFGEMPDNSARKRLRAADVRFALWEPFDDASGRSA